MKKHNRMNPSRDADPGRRRLLTLAALTGISGLARSREPREKPACLLSLHEANFYARHDLAG